jgi:hypothetical protein
VLLRHLEAGTTGRLQIDEGEDQVFVYVTQGEVVAAEARSDREQILQQLRRNPDVSEETADRLAFLAETSASLSDWLSENLPRELAAACLRDRFRENVAAFLHSKQVPTFIEMGAVLADNTQVGHDTMALLSELGGGDPEDAGAHEVIIEVVDEASSSAAGFEGAMHEEVLSLGPAYEPSFEVPRTTTSTDLPKRTVFDLDGTSSAGRESARDLIFHDLDARPGTSGEFSAPKEHLDYVDLDLPAEGASPFDSTLVETGEEDPGRPSIPHGLSLNFGSPKLDTEEAKSKIDVLNAVLEEFCLALDRARGPGSGQATVQLLLDATPARIAVLFHGLETRRNGMVNPSALLKNLARIPEGEQRQRLHLALEDLVERGLAVIDEHVSGDEVEAVFERIAVYQRRMRL